MSKTTYTEKTKTAPIGGSTYIRIPPHFCKHIQLNKAPENVTIAMAEGKHGKFLWIQRK